MDEFAASPARHAPTVTDLEIKDAQLIFSAVWADLIENHGRDNLRFPREFIWLGGAPGAGKGTNTPFIAETRDITAPPIVVSSLLTSPQAVAIKNAGKMVGDREVIGLLFEELLAPQYHEGVIIDGFPRTKVQVGMSEDVLPRACWSCTASTGPRRWRAISASRCSASPCCS